MRLTAEELRARAAEDALVIIPVASLEQHGPHMATGASITWVSGVAARPRRHRRTGAPVAVTPGVWTGLGRAPTWSLAAR